MSTGSFYPFETGADYVLAVNLLLDSCAFDVAAADDGYLLLRRNAAAQTGETFCAHTLPDAFYRFAYTTLPQTAWKVDATFLGGRNW